MDKNREFLKFWVNFKSQRPIWSFWKWFSLKIMKLDEQLSVKSFFISLFFIKLYLINFGPNFGCLFLLSDEDWVKTNYVGLISAQKCTFGWMRKFLLQSWLESNFEVWKVFFMVHNFVFKLDLAWCGMALVCSLTKFRYSFISKIVDKITVWLSYIHWQNSGSALSWK